MVRESSKPRSTWVAYRWKLPTTLLDVSYSTCPLPLQILSPLNLRENMASPCHPSCSLAYPELDWNLGFPRLEPVSTIFYARARYSYCAPINLQSTNLHNVGLQLRVGSSSLSKFVLVLSINARACTPCPPQTFEFVSKQACKLQATLDGCNPKLRPPTDSLTGVKCRATSVAKN